MVPYNVRFQCICVSEYQVIHTTTLLSGCSPSDYCKHNLIRFTSLIWSLVHVPRPRWPYLPSKPTRNLCHDISESYELYPAHLLLLIYQIASSERFGIILRGCVTSQSPLYQDAAHVSVWSLHWYFLSSSLPLPYIAALKTTRCRGRRQ